jgi:sterol desaturase/sphingolipid hydroxylase (fatty acid hydroxylase superfamily)
MIIAFSFIKLFRLKKVQNDTHSDDDYKREFKYSILSLFLVSFISTLVYKTDLINHSTLYYNISDYGLLYYFAIIPLILIIYDLYFFLIHLFIHNKKIFKIVHLVHHQSKTISPLAAYSMHPLEAIFQHIGLILLFFLFPIHTSHVYIWVIASLAYSSYLHLGYEIFSDKFLKSNIGKFILSSTAHNNHHKYFNCNFGFYTLIWDKLFKTEKYA